MTGRRGRIVSGSMPRERSRVTIERSSSKSSEVIIGETHSETRKSSHNDGSDLSQSSAPIGGEKDQSRAAAEFPGNKGARPVESIRVKSEEMAITINCRMIRRNNGGHSAISLNESAKR
jgi:hypothetical protein